MTDSKAWWLLIPVLLLSFSVARGQPGDVLPDWLVPVVRVLPDNRVIPATGIYLGEERVLVPSELTADGATLLVLDGGSDLARFGREARIEQSFNVSGLTVLRVAGLQRTQPVLGLFDPLTDDEVALKAFPPPSLIAAGRGSLSVRTTIEDGQGNWTISRDRPLPNVTGAMVDACGQWIGHSAARGVASMASSQNTQYRFLSDLRPLLEQAGVPLQSAACEETWPQPVQPVIPTLAPGSVSEPDPGRPSQTESEPDDPEPGPGPASEPEAELLPVPEPGLDPDPAPEAEPVEPAADAASWPWWLAGLGLLLVAALAWILRRRKASRDEPGEGSVHSPVTRSDIQPFARLQGPGVDHVLVAVNGQVDLSLGRFDTDVLLRSTTASRNHARLHGGPDDLYLEDMGSSNGSWCNGVRCSAFKPIEVHVGDELVFADEHFRLVTLDGDEGS